MRKTHRQRKAEKGAASGTRMSRRMKALRKMVEQGRVRFASIWDAPPDTPVASRMDFKKTERRKARQRPDAERGCVVLATGGTRHRTLYLWRHQKLTPEHIAQRAEFAARVSR